MNIPKTILDNANTIMICGIGGGFDVFTGLPIVYHYPNKQFVLVNSGPGDFHFRKSTEKDYPEALIAERGNILAKWTVGRHGCGLVKKAYEAIFAEHKPDAILAVDGGVDSLMRGDEDDHGTILEDFIAMSALSSIDVPKILCCAGFGTETEENLNHYCVLENMAELAKLGAFLGSFSLTNHMSEFKQYAKQCEDVWQEAGRKSHIQTKIISAANGRFGSDNQYSNIDAKVACSTDVCFISLLSSIYWFFDFDKVVARNKILNAIKGGNTFTDCKILLKNFLNKNRTNRRHEELPL